MNIPDKMWAIVQRKAGGDLNLEQVAIPVPGPGEVLVKMEYAPINPSDLSFLQGTYALKPEYPVVPGIEGSGVVVAAGKGVLPRMRLGKRVSCTSTKGKGGSWAEYMLTSAMHVIPVGKMDMKDAAMLIVNPLTALSLIEIAKSENQKAIVNNAANSSLGKMINRLAKKQGIKCINIVRSKDKARKLKDEGTEIVLDNSHEDFYDDYKRLINQYNATLILDPVGGPRARALLKSAPFSTKILFYSNLSEQETCFDPRLLVQEDKSMQGFYLATHSAKKSLLKSLSDTKKVQNMIKDTLHSEIRKLISPDSINQAIEEYRANMSEGKILISMKMKKE